MVSLRCNGHVKDEFRQLGIPIVAIEPGIVQVKKALTESVRVELNHRLRKYGMQILGKKQHVIVAYVLGEIEKNIHTDNPRPIKDILVKLTTKKYAYADVSSLFSEVTGTDLKQYIKVQQIEKVKEMLIYDQKTVKQIAEVMPFKNRAQLSYLFKKITGLSPSFYLKLKKGRIRNKMKDTVLQTNLNRANYA